MILCSIFRIINQQHPSNLPYFFSNIKPDVHASTKIKTLTFYKGVGVGGGWLLAKPNGGFAFKVRFVNVFFTFWQGSLNPPNY